MPQILQLRVDDSTMEAIAELGKRQYPSSLPDRHGEALGYDRLAVLNDILSAGLAALTDGDAAVPPTPIAKRSRSKTATPPEDTAWISRLEALESEVSRLGQLLESSPTAVAAVPSSTTVEKAKPTRTATRVVSTVTSVVPIATKAVPTPEKTTRTTPAAVKSTVKAGTPSITKPVVKPIAKSAPATTSTTPSSSVKKAKTPSRRRRSSSQMNPDEVKKLQDAPSLSKNGLASLCRCDKRTLDRKREEGELGQFTRERCGAEYAYKVSDARYYKVN